VVSPATNMSARILRLDLRAVFYKESGVWFCHCLEMDVMGHGRTKKSALGMMNRAISEQIHMSIRHHNLSNIFQPADARFFQMYAAGEDALHGKIEVVDPEVEENSADRVEIADLETKQYTGQLVEC